MRKWLVAVSCTAFVLGVVACKPQIPKEALMLSQESLAQRQLQTRRFDTSDEALLLSASAGVLQDLGYTIEESETDLGLIFGTKDRDATEAGQVAGAILVAVFLGASVPFDTDQKIRVSLVTRPSTDGKATLLRVTFQRIVWNSHRQVSKIEGLNSPELYQQFFEKLSQSVFLTAHEI